MAANIYTEVLPSGFAFDMILVEGGAFRMGGDDPDADNDEKPVHEVHVSTFYLGQVPVTQDLWKAIMGEGNNPSYFKGDRRPVEVVSWNDAQRFIQKMNDETKKDRQEQGLGDYRLPTEAEWEFAARGGAYSEGYLYSGSDKLEEVGWCDENSNSQTHDVGLLMANEIGLYDMSGNVKEWIEDYWHDNYRNAPCDGSAWLHSYERTRRVVRGGFCFIEAKNCRNSSRSYYSMDGRDVILGFRLALSSSAND